MHPGGQGLASQRSRQPGLTFCCLSADFTLRGPGDCHHRSPVLSWTSICNLLCDALISELVPCVGHVYIVESPHKASAFDAARTILFILFPSSAPISRLPVTNYQSIPASPLLSQTDQAQPGLSFDRPKFCVVLLAYIRIAYHCQACH